MKRRTNGMVEKLEGLKSASGWRYSLTLAGYQAVKIL
jgi:hypothetical protein